MNKRIFHFFFTIWCILLLVAPHGYAFNKLSQKVISPSSSAPLSSIGTPGCEGFGVGVCPPMDLPPGFSGLDGYADPTSENYGNYIYTDGSALVFIPKFYYKVGTGENGFSVNEIDIKEAARYSSRTHAAVDGYALHRAFIDGGTEKSGFFIDKYLCSNNNGVASSVKNGNPLSTSAALNPINALRVEPENNHAGTIDAAKGRGPIFNVASRFMYSALAMISMAHGQASLTSTHCAWYDPTGISNFPKGYNAPGFSDINDSSVKYDCTDEMTHPTAGKTGSGKPFAKTTHNGQNSGVADLNGVRFEVSLGITVPGETDNDLESTKTPRPFYVLKESVALKDLTSGWSNYDGIGNYEAWGSRRHLSHLYDQISIPYISNDTKYSFGSGSNQVLSEKIDGEPWLLTGLGFPKDRNGFDRAGTPLFGNDLFFDYYRPDLVALSSGTWLHNTHSGIWHIDLFNSCFFSYYAIGFRTACYPK